MSRKFKDRQGAPWIVEHPHGSTELIFRLLEGPETDQRTIPLPSHTNDPFELSDQELQRLLDQSKPRYGKPKRPPPFKD